MEWTVATRKAEKLGQIEQRDAVSNVKVGIHQSTLLTKQYFHAMDLMYKEVNYDLLNEAKFVYKDGITGTIVLGDHLTKTFTALPEHYTMTDFDIHIEDSAESFKMREQLQASTTELIKAQFIDPVDLVEIVRAKNMTQLKRYLTKALSDKKAENNTIGQLQQQVEQLTGQQKEYEKQIKQYEEQVQSLQKQLQNNSKRKMDIEQQRVQIEDRVARDKKDYNDKLIEVKNKQLQAEILQIRDGNPYNDQIRDV